MGYSILDRTRRAFAAAVANSYQVHTEKRNCFPYNGTQLRSPRPLWDASPNPPGQSTTIPKPYTSPLFGEPLPDPGYLGQRNSTRTSTSEKEVKKRAKCRTTLPIPVPNPEPPRRPAAVIAAQPPRLSSSLRTLTRSPLTKPQRLGAGGREPLNRMPPLFGTPSRGLTPVSPLVHLPSVPTWSPPGTSPLDTPWVAPRALARTTLATNPARPATEMIPARKRLGCTPARLGARWPA
jgi:hypothetical protein